MKLAIRLSENGQNGRAKMDEDVGCARRRRFLISFQIGRVGGGCKFPETGARSLSMFNVGPRSAAPTLTQAVRYILYPMYPIYSKYITELTQKPKIFDIS